MDTPSSMRYIPERSERGYRLCLPRPLPGNFLNLVAERFIERRSTIIGHGALHLYAIANSAVPLCVAILASSHASGLYNRDVLSFIYPQSDELIGSQSRSDEVPVLFDNSVRTGQTLRQAMEILGNNRQHVRQVVTLVDYEDDTHATLTAHIAALYDIEVTSLFTASEFLENTI